MQLLKSGLKLCLLETQRCFRCEESRKALCGIKPKPASNTPCRAPCSHHHPASWAGWGPIPQQTIRSLRNLEEISLKLQSSSFHTHLWQSLGPGTHICQFSSAPVQTPSHQAERSCALASCCCWLEYLNGVFYNFPGWAWYYRVGEREDPHTPLLSGRAENWEMHKEDINQSCHSLQKVLKGEEIFSTRRNKNKNQFFTELYDKALFSKVSPSVLCYGE